MTISSMHGEQRCRRNETVYTVVCKSGQRGIEFSDPGLAAQAFFRAQEQDRPFVLRHRGDASFVIASAKAGAKQIAANWTGDDQFRTAYESLLRRE